MPEPTPTADVRREHWEAFYRDKSDAGLSWRQEDPALSLALALRLARRDDAVVDIGAGESALAGRLARAGYRAVTALDISAAAIDRARARAGEHAASVRWVVADVLSSPDLGAAALWHDRAVFHFVTDEQERRQYAALAARTVVPGGHAVIAAFAPDGPERCSGLPVRRYNAEALAQAFAPAFELVGAERETHTTPWGKDQPFIYAVLRRSTA